MSQFVLDPLPYALDALEPFLSAKTLDLHYNKHHKTYLDNLNALLANDTSNDSLEDVIRKAHHEKITGVFNNAGQVYNHTFYWKCMKANGGGQPTGNIADLINTVFGSFAAFREKFIDAGKTLFGSGWVWLVASNDTCEILKTSNAENPLHTNATPLLVCDVWEHAYYVDYQNKRAGYLETFLDNLVNWDFVETQLHHKAIG